MSLAVAQKRLFLVGSGGFALAVLGAGLSVAFHGGLALAVLSLPKDQKREAHAIAIREAKKHPPKPPEPTKLEEKPKPKEKAQQKTQSHAKTAPAEAKPDAAPARPAGNSTAMEGMPDFGLSLSGGTGPGGLALPGGGGASGPADTPAAAGSKKPQALAARHDDDCADALVRPKPTRQVQPAYNDGARADKIEGRVRVEVQVDDRGKVSSARVLSGLGHGLDEAALAAVKQWTFEPATRCGKPLAHTIVVPFTFKIAQ